MATGAAIVVVKERHIIEAFEMAGAITPERARRPEEIGVGTGGIAWNLVIDHGWLREASPGAYYVDIPRWVQGRRRRRRFLVFMLIFMALVVVALGAMGVFATRH